MGESAVSAESAAASATTTGSPQTCDAQVMQGDVVRSRLRVNGQLGWVCCITPESDEAHIYWQPRSGIPAADSREPLKALECADRALIPGDIVRRYDIAAGESQDHGGRDRDAMGMVVGTEVMLDLQVLGEKASPKEPTVRKAVPASSLCHLVPIRLVTWVVHRADGWLGRVQSWDEDLILRFKERTPPTTTLPSAGLLATSTPGISRCRIRAANLKQGLTITESFYRDFFPGLVVGVNLQDLKSGLLDCEWLAGDVSRVAGDAKVDGMMGAPQKVEAVIEEVAVGMARVEWLAQVPLRRGASSDQPPRSDGCPEDKLLFLLGEAECSSRWALGDRLRLEGALAEVCKVETFVGVRWQDDALSVRVPARELQLCNPDAFSFFPSELVCQRILDDAAGGAPPAPPPRSSASPQPTPPSGGESARGASGDGAGAGGGPLLSERGRRDDQQQQPRVGFVVRADPASRMVSVSWLDEGGPSAEEEWSAFDLQIDPEFGYRLGDAVIRCCDWEESSPSSQRTPKSSSPLRDGEGVGPRVGQVAALESGSVRVRWLDGAVSRHAPRDLYRVGDEEEGSLVESQDGTADDGPPTGRVRTASEEPQAVRSEPAKEQGRMCEAAAEENLFGSTPERGSAPEVGGGSGETGAEDVVAAGQVDAEQQPAGSGGSSAGHTDADAASGSTGGRAPQALSAPQLEAGDMVEVSFEDMAWEPLPTDHHFVHMVQRAVGPAGRQLMRRVQKEWQILQRGLPHGVWVHVYPDRMELLRACIVGPEGTPYSDALFFFDVLLPPTYPQIPPQVRFWSFGENLNPNLYENGKVCLSLLGTWSGKDSETWSSERSNLLQVLVSILGLVLNTEPYYNEPGFERERETPQGGLRSQRYNESVALSSYHLMLRVLRSPPGDFDHISKRHFAERRAAILERARGLQLGDGGGSEGGATVAAGSSSGSEGFRKSLAALLPRLEEQLPKEPPP
mmetsp:Transcript_45149/g.144619  ORF Transcript_45149/g.144619 Transcript_45149/m.144619 type:complete len:966 (-) Transcript_45149:148-3045(-)